MATRRGCRMAAHTARRIHPVARRRRAATETASRRCGGREIARTGPAAVRACLALETRETRQGTATILPRTAGRDLSAESRRTGPAAVAARQADPGAVAARRTDSAAVAARQ